MIIWYNVIDAETKEILYENMTAGRIEKEIGMPSGYVYGYAEKGLVYQKKYQIQKVGEAQNKLWEEWDRVTAHLRQFPYVIRNIKITCELGEDLQAAGGGDGR